MPIKAIAINCTLKAKGESSTDAMIAVLEKAFAKVGVEVTETIRIAEHDVKPGVTSDEGDGDAWPAIRKKILAHDILIFGGPIWMGQLGSIGKRVLERMDAFLDETDDEGRMPSYGKVAVAAIVGNEDGAHWSSAQIFQSLNDTGWTIPPVAACYWVGEAMGSVDFKDLEKTPEKVTKTASMVATNAAHLAKLLKAEPLPGAG
ncbi:NAD(P)H-dependent oxidoreductase [Sphingomonas sp. SUN019]|uniref:flavodoxin family protein n=1 Tax=Sphingomonas sp. SUN019 TaxID=2937788 RepID=UPI002164BD7A|nr:NAD(P)H-dependent oxidoreductase [Sphingomonas sp. SUN019]UVO50299.1 NAD(P)H-dependent oxidoreductase [Sphingomonas sp. SUN019]